MKTKIERHGLLKSVEYSLWGSIIQRCCNPKNSTYPNYGGRGIFICKGWRESFSSFYKDFCPRPSPSLSIDRIDNDGHYSCGHCDECIEKGWAMNCRWATKQQQRLNQRQRKSKSGLVGVRERCGKFEASTRIGGKYSYLGVYSTPQDAQKAVVEGKTVILNSYGKGETQG